MAETSGCLLRATTFGGEPGLTARFCQFAHAQDVALSFGNRNYATRIEEIEYVARLDALVVGGKRHEMTLLLAVGPTSGEIFLASSLCHLELLEQHRGVCDLKIV